LAAAILQSPASAQGRDATVGGVDFNVSGFGTFGVVRTDTNAVQFVRDSQQSGATQTLSEKVDSNLAVQLSARVSSWLSATVQVLGQQHQYSRYLTADVAWAYLKIEPLDSLTFKLGRVEMPLFAISDSRDINYANIWVRPPNEVYALANIEELNGAEVTYELPLGPTRLSLTGFVGNSVTYLGGSPLAAKPFIVTPFAAAPVAVPPKIDNYDVYGGEVRWETEWITLRAGIATSRPHVLPQLYDKYRFSGFGLLMDHANIVAQAEFVARKSAVAASIIDSNGWYAMSGYRFGKVLPYVLVASTVKSKPNYGLALTFDQTSEAIGVRWDAFRSADLKLELERVDPKGTTGISFAEVAPGFRGNVVYVASVTLDFVF
jgi:hypothetical protein